MYRGDCDVKRIHRSFVRQGDSLQQHFPKLGRRLCLFQQGDILNLLESVSGRTWVACLALIDH